MATRGIAVEAILDTKREAVTVQRCPSNEKKTAATGISNDGSGVKRLSKSHHEYINVGVSSQVCQRGKSPREIMNQNHSQFEWEGAGIDHLLKHVKLLEERNFLLEDMNKKLRKENRMLSLQLQEVMQHRSREAESVERCRSSRAIIYQFNCLEGLLLDMGLPQYVIPFANERINGKLFLELDDVALELDLGINSSLHRKRLMCVIRGSHHVADIINNSRTLV